MEMPANHGPPAAAPTLQIEVHRRRMDVGGDGKKGSVDVFVIVLLDVSTSALDDGTLVFVQEPPEKRLQLELPYAIWVSHEPQRHRFRWAYRPTTNDEKRIGIASHGAAEDMRHAVGACLTNYLEREQIQERKA